MKRVEEQNIIIGKRLKEYRENKGYTQEEVAKEIDVNPKHYGRIERGENSCTISNIQANFKWAREYPDQKSLSATDREENVKGVFNYSGVLNEKTVVLIDDISSTGSTIKECIRELKRCGAKEVVVILLAINQNCCSAYWSSDSPKVVCPQCGEIMILTPNRNGNFFFSCHACYKAGRGNILGFNDGWKQLCKSENMRFNEIINQGKAQLSSAKKDKLSDLSRCIQCPFCKSDNKIDFFDYSTVTSHKRPMGTDSLYEVNERFTCASCQMVFRVKGYISFYPGNSFESERIDVSSDVEE